MSSEQNSANGGIAQNPAEQTVPVQVQNAGMVSEKDHKELEAFATRNRQLAIQMATEAAKANPKSLLSIPDSKVQNAVAKEIYGLDSFAQVKAVYGDEFWKSSENKEDGDEDKISQMERKLRMFETKSESDRVENAINSLKASNPNLLKSDADEESLRNELSLISSKVSPEERVKKAARILFGDTEAQKAKELLQYQNAASGSGTAYQNNQSASQAGDLKAYFMETLNPYKKK
jgi:hypothetical protein